MIGLTYFISVSRGQSQLRGGAQSPRGERSPPYLQTYSLLAKQSFEKKIVQLVVVIISNITVQ